MLGQGFQQGKVLLRERFLYALDDEGVVQGILEFICLACAAVRKTYLQVELNGLFRVALPRINADQGFDLEFMQKDDVHWISLCISLRDLEVHAGCRHPKPVFSIMIFTSRCNRILGVASYPMFSGRYFNCISILTTRSLPATFHIKNSFEVFQP